MGIDGRKRTAHNSEYKGNNLLKMDETYEKTNRREVTGEFRIRFLVITADAPVLSSVASKFARVGWGGSDMYSRASFSSTGKYLPTGIELGKNLNF